MYYNRNLITAEQHPTDAVEASGVFNLAAQAYSQSEKDWPILDDDFDVAFRIELGTARQAKITRHTLGPVTYTVDWGDGTALSTETDVSVAHNYSSSGIYIIKLKRVSGADFSVNNFSFSVITGVFFNANYSAPSKISFLEQVILKDLGLHFSAYQNVTDLSQAFRFCTFLEEFPLINVSSCTNFYSTWFACHALKTFPALSFNSATNLSSAWERCYSLHTFPSITNTSNVTNFYNAWKDCLSLTTFPLIDTSGGTNFQESWRDCASLASFSSINTSSGTNFYQSWYNCLKLTTFPSLNFGSATTFRQAWQDCHALTTFPANMFDSTGSLASNAFFRAFEDCSLTAQSIENILTSLDTNGATGIQLHIGGGSNASYSTWSQAAKDALTSLQGKSWSVTYNS